MERLEYVKHSNRCFRPLTCHTKGPLRVMCNKRTEQEEWVKNRILFHLLPLGRLQALWKGLSDSLPIIALLDKTASVGLGVEWQGEGATDLLVENGSVLAPGRRGTRSGNIATERGAGFLRETVFRRNPFKQ